MLKALSPSQDFSLVLGGPLYQLYLRTRVSRGALELLHRRIAGLTLIGWLPLLVLSALAGHAGGGVAVPFLKDLETHARFLVAVPLLVAAELLVHQRLGPILRQFLERDLVPPESRAGFEDAVARAMRLRNSVPCEIAIAALALAAHAAWRTQMAIDAPTWYATSSPDGLVLRPAGWYLALVSLPLFRFLILRWYFRLAIWAILLWRISRLELRLLATHPDGAAGLGFLDASAFAFAPLLSAHGALLSGHFANRIFFTGARLPEFKLEILALVAFLCLITLGPLCAFTPGLARARRRALRAYGRLASRYVQEFDRRWVGGAGTVPGADGASDPEPLLGSADIQSLADMGNAFDVVQKTKSFVFSRQTWIQLVAATALPLAPLVLTMIPLEELIDRLVGVVL